VAVGIKLAISVFAGWNLSENDTGNNQRGIPASIKTYSLNNKIF